MNKKYNYSATFGIDSWPNQPGDVFVNFALTTNNPANALKWILDNKKSCGVPVEQHIKNFSGPNSQIFTD